jgi:hypothetical protein
MLEKSLLPFSADPYTGNNQSIDLVKPIVNTGTTPNNARRPDPADNT